MPRAPIVRYTLAEVVALRAVGFTWDHVRRELGTTAQALHQRWRRWGQPSDPELNALVNASRTHPCARCGHPASRNATLCLSCHRAMRRTTTT